MARYCIVAPSQMLVTLDEQGYLGSSHLVLAHDIVETEEKRQTYAQLFNAGARIKAGKSPAPMKDLILDNSVVELGNAVDPKMIREAADIVRPTCIVLPDVMSDGYATMERTYEALSTWRTELEKSPYQQVRQTPFLLLPQGRSLDEFAVCAERFAHHESIHWWGVPRLMTEHTGTRKFALELVQKLNHRRIIHLFGFSSNMVDDFMCAKEHYVNSIDSAVPMRIENKFRITMDPPGPRGKWWEKGQVSPTTIDNLKAARKVFAD